MFIGGARNSTHGQMGVPAQGNTQHASGLRSMGSMGSMGSMDSSTGAVGPDLEAPSGVALGVRFGTCSGA